jgi:uncharacterized protein
MTMYRAAMLWLLALLALGSSAAWAALPPRPTGPVADLAAIIPDDQERQLDARLRAYNQATGRAVIVATVPSLDGQDVARYAQELAQAWDIGGKESTEGVLLLVAPTERKLRIHAAIGSQGRLTDGLASRIIRETITPRFKANDFGGGISAGVEQIIAQLDRDPTDAKAVAEAADAARSSRSGSGGDVSVVSVIFWIVLVVFLIMLIARSRRRYRGHRSPYKRGIDLWDIGEFAANVAANVAINAAFNGDGDGGFGGGGGDSGGGFGGFGGGGGGFDGGGASGDW